MKTESDKAEPKKRPLKTILYVALTVLFVLFAIYTIHDLFFSGAGVGHFKSAEGHRAYLSAYDEVMATLSAPTEARDVPTTWGTVRVYRWANTARPNALPVVLLPGHLGEHYALFAHAGHR